MKKTILIISAVAFIFSCKKEYITQEGDIINNTTVTENKSIETELYGGWKDTSVSLSTLLDFAPNHNFKSGSNQIGTWYMNRTETSITIDIDTASSWYKQIDAINSLQYYLDTLKSLGQTRDILTINYIDIDSTILDVTSSAINQSFNLIQI